MVVHYVRQRPALPTAEATFSESAVAAIQARGGLWIAAQSIDTAHLRPGISTGRLLVLHTDGRHTKLLWVRSHATYDQLRDALRGWIGDRLVLG